MSVAFSPRPETAIWRQINRSAIRRTETPGKSNSRLADILGIRVDHSREILMSRKKHVANIAGLSCVTAILAGTAGVAFAQPSLASALPTAAPAAVCSLKGGEIHGNGFALKQTYDVKRNGKTIARVAAGPKGDIRVGITGSGPVSVGTVRCTPTGSTAASTKTDAAAATARGAAAAQQAARGGASKTQAAAIGRKAAASEAKRLGLAPAVVNQVTNNVTNIVNNTIIGGSNNTIGGTQVGNGNTQGGTQGAGNGNTQGGTQ
ncbi:hypothetical protein, partial [Streptomyces virginiae]|uniref:hypothetical protein n=4 Tax=Streptomyces TaxID=1883 RepID=UPI00348A720E